MWSVLASAFLALLAFLLHRVARQRSVPNALRVAPLLMLLVIMLAAGAQYFDIEARLQRTPITTWQSVLDADEYVTLFEGQLPTRDDGDEWVYTTRMMVPSELRVQLEGGEALLTSPIIIGEPAGLGHGGLRSGGRVIVEGARNEYSDGSSYFDAATVYARDLEGYRDFIGLERWIYLAGALLALVALVGFAFAWFVGRKREDPQTF